VRRVEKLEDMVAQCDVVTIVSDFHGGTDDRTARSTMAPAVYSTKNSSAR
jgi:hypothetical protein